MFDPITVTISKQHKNKASYPLTIKPTSHHRTTVTITCTDFNIKTAAETESARDR